MSLEETTPFERGMAVCLHLGCDPCVIDTFLVGADFLSDKGMLVEEAAIRDMVDWYKATTIVLKEK
jgi:hypothetical protein